MRESFSLILTCQLLIWNRDARRRRCLEEKTSEEKRKINYFRDYLAKLLLLCTFWV